MSDLRIAEGKSIESVTVKRAKTKDSHWRVWETFCAEHSIDKYFRNVQPQLPFLQVFAHRLRLGLISPSGKPIFSGTVCDFLATVGEEISRMGPQNRDPRYGVSGKLHVVLRQQYRAYSKDDPPPERVKPIPLQLLRHTVNCLQCDGLSRAMADLLVIGMFFLLRPGEYCYNKDGDNFPFRMQDVSFDIAGVQTNATVIPLPSLDTAALVLMRFTNQKNGIRDEDIFHGPTTDPLICPRKAVARRIKHLRANDAPPDTPLHTVFVDGTAVNISSQSLTQSLRQALGTIGESLNIAPSEISARALRAGGAMALFRANVDPENIQLVGRWRSWAMREYLHRSATDTSSYAQKMLNFGNFTIQRLAPYPLPQDALAVIQPYVEANPEPII